MLLPTLNGNAPDDLTAVYQDRIFMIERHINWYRRKKRAKQRWSLFFRILALLFAIVGGICPLIPGAFSSDARQWGYPILALSGALLIFDKLMGYSTSWMRFMETTILLEGRAEAFKINWLRAMLEGSNNGSYDTQELFNLVEQLNVDIYQIVTTETAKWINEFKSNDLDTILPTSMKTSTLPKEKAKA